MDWWQKGTGPRKTAQREKSEGAAGRRNYHRRSPAQTWICDSELRQSTCGPRSQDLRVRRRDHRLGEILSCPVPLRQGGKYDQTLQAKEGDYFTDKLTDAALDFIERKKDQPFFVHLEHFAVHDPIEGRKDLVEKYKKKLAKMGRSMRTGLYSGRQSGRTGTVGSEYR